MRYVVIDLACYESNKTCEDICVMLGISKLQNCGQRTEDTMIVAGIIREEMSKEDVDELLYTLPSVLDISIKDKIDQYPNMGEINILDKATIETFGIKEIERVGTREAEESRI